MRCKKCRRVIGRGEFCRPCLVKVIERRVRKHMRLDAVIKKGSRILVMDPLSGYFARALLPVVEIIRKPKSSFGIKSWDNTIYNNIMLRHHIRQNRIDIAFAPLPMETGLEDYIRKLFLGKTSMVIKRGRIFPLFSQVTTEELALFCDYKRLRFTPAKGKIMNLLRMMEESYPGTKASFAKAIKQQNIK